MNSAHLQVLAFANENPNGITLEQLKLKFPTDYEWIEREISDNNLFTGTGSREKLYLTFEDRFRLLEHEELKNANNSSRTATYFATAALIVSILTTLISICFFYKQQNSVIRLDESQIQKIITIKDTNTNTQLRDIIQKQTETINELKKIVQSPNKNLHSTAPTTHESK